MRLLEGRGEALDGEEGGEPEGEGCGCLGVHLYWEGGEVRSVVLMVGRVGGGVEGIGGDARLGTGVVV